MQSQSHLALYKYSPRSKNLLPLVCIALHKAHSQSLTVSSKKLQELNSMDYPHFTAKKTKVRKLEETYLA